MRPINSFDDVIEAISGLTSSGLSRRTVLVRNTREAHALRRELLRAYRGELLLGTRFLTLRQLAEDVLRSAGVRMGPEPAPDGARIRALLRSIPADRFEALDESVRRDAGWDLAFARALHDLEAAGHTPTSMRDGAGSEVDAGMLHDAATLFTELRPAGPPSSRSQVLVAAAEIVRERPELANEPTLHVIHGHESLVESELIAALPDARLAIRVTRPAAPEWLERVETLFGAEARDTVMRATSFHSRSARDFLSRYLFAAPSVLASASRDRASEDDTTVQLEQHAGVDAELEAAATWVAQKVLDDGMSLDDIAVLAPHADPWLALLATRISARLPVPSPVAVPEGLPFAASSDGARTLTLLRALAQHLSREALIELLPMLVTQRQISRNDAIELCATVGGAGGSAQRLDGAAEWEPRWLRALGRTGEALALLDESDPSKDRERRALLRLEDRLADTAPAIKAMCSLAQLVASSTSVAGLAEACGGFLREHVRLATPDHVDARLRGLAASHETGDAALRPRGDEALQLLVEAVASARLTVAASDCASVYVGTVRGARGLSFRAVRIVGLAEGSLPSVPRQDPVLSDATRRALRPALPTASLRGIEALQALHQVIGDTRDEVVLSCPRQAIDGSQREPSSIFVDAAAALGGHPGPLVPSRSVVEHHYFRRSEASRTRGSQALVAPHGFLRGVARGAVRRPAEWSDDVVFAPERCLDGGAIREPHATLEHVPSSRPLPGVAPERPISASRLATLLACPRWFFLRSVLGFDEPSTLARTGGLSALDYGSLFHRVAERFAIDNGPAFGRRERSLDEWRPLAQALGAEELERLLEISPITNPEVARHEGERLALDLSRWLEHDWDQGRPRVFVAAERSFGFESPLAVEVEGEAMHVRGVIDRLDVEARGGDTSRLLVRDLKTGRSKPRRGKDAAPRPDVDLQLGLYGRVATQLAEQWRTPDSVAVAYVHPRSPAEIERRFDDDYATLEAAARTWLAVGGAMLRGGAFPRTPDARDCAFCPFVPVCGPPVSAPSDDDATKRFLTWKLGDD